MKKPIKTLIVVTAAFALMQIPLTFSFAGDAKDPHALLSDGSTLCFNLATRGCGEPLTLSELLDELND